MKLFEFLNKDSYLRKMWHKKSSFGQTLCMTGTTEFVAEKYIQHRCAQWLRKKTFQGQWFVKRIYEHWLLIPTCQFKHQLVWGGGSIRRRMLNSNIHVMIKQTERRNNIPNWICSRSLLVENYIDLFKRRTKKSVLSTEKVLIQEFMGNWKLQCLKRFPPG